MADLTQGAMPGQMFGGGSGYGGIWAGGPNTVAEGIGQLGPAAFNQSLSQNMAGAQLGSAMFNARTAADTARMQDATARRGQDAQLQASLFPTQSRNAHFDQVFPFLSGALNGLVGQGGYATAGGQSPSGPQFSAGPIWSNAQIQQQINSQMGANNQNAANQIRGMQQGLAARGLNPNSALAQALSGQINASAMQNNTALGTQLPFTLAAQNAQFARGGQQLQEQQRASMANEDIARRTPIFGTTNSLISALSGLI